MKDDLTRTIEPTGDDLTDDELQLVTGSKGGVAATTQLRHTRDRETEYLGPDGNGDWVRRHDHYPDYVV